MGSEQRLWRAVLAQLIVDATSTNNKKEFKDNREAARQYLTNYSIDLEIVCILAEIPVTDVITRIKKIIKA